MLSETPPIERAFFRETEDGETVFFPFGLTRRGYLLDGPAAKRRARRGASFLMLAPIAIGTWTAHALQPLFEPDGPGAGEILRTLAPPGAAMLAALLGYWIWASRFVEPLPESSLVVSREERLREAAAVARPGRLALVGLVTVALGGLVIWIAPHLWWLAAAAAALGIAMAAWALVLSRAAGPKAS